MLHALAAAAQLCLAGAAAVPFVTDEPRIVRRTPHAARYLTLISRVTVAGVTGRSVSTVDLATGRYAERVEAGIVSYGDGFDGHRVWTSDATGMPSIEENAETRLDRLAWAHFYGRIGPERPSIRRLRGATRSVALRLRYAGLSAPIDVTEDRRTRNVTRIEEAAFGERTTVSFGGYRTVAGAVLPYELRLETPYDVVRESVVAVAPAQHVADAAFDPPTPPADTTLHGVTSVPMRIEDGTPVVAVRINGRSLRLSVDSGSTNVLTFAAARALGLRLIGRGKTGGIGPGQEPERYTQADRLEIGAAVLRHQPFAVVASAHAPGDGLIGAELLERLAVQLDFENRYLRLAADATMLGDLGTPVPMRLNARLPEVDGAFDAIAGPVSIDTGSATALDVYAPVVRRYGLRSRYDTWWRLESKGFGGTLVSYAAFASRVRIGTKTIFGVPIELDATKGGAFSTTAQIGNAGIPLLRAFTPTFDYRRRTLWLAGPRNAPFPTF